ncbi:hypothetical protein [Saliphagus sp. LR7]|uniref:hypothetical protein n=1 Tax=Saliphagus sp. LR7 TaxID=2282654 RepID=UPI000DF7CFF8|nr:hypothetical protein [Saliphagus sp. LR7]
MSDPRVRPFLRARLRPGDLAVHAAVAALLVGVYLAPVPYTEFLFRPATSGPREAYLSLLGHANAVHLAGNVAGYLLVSLLALCLLAPRRRLYYAFVAALFLIVPPIAAVVMEPLLARTAPAAIGSYRGAGFSLLTAALVGLLTVAVAVHQADRLAGPLPPELAAPALFSVALAVPALRYDAPRMATAVAALFGLAGLAYGTGVLARSYRRRPVLEVALSMTALATFLGAASDLFPPRPGVVGIEPHFVGLLAGFALSWLVWIAWRGLATQ